MMDIFNEDNVLSGTPIDEDFAAGIASLGEFYLQRLAAQNDHVSLINGVTGAELSSENIRLGAVRVAQCLRAAGLTDADTVAICSENRNDTAFIMFGTVLIGGVLVPMNPTYTARELSHALHLAGPKVIFATAATIDAVSKGAQKCASVERIICLDGLPGGLSADGQTVMDYAEFVGLEKECLTGAHFDCKPQEMDKKVALILFSSGTTGLPKGVELTERNVLMTIAQHE